MRDFGKLFLILLALPLFFSCSSRNVYPPGLVGYWELYEEAGTPRSTTEDDVIGVEFTKDGSMEYSFLPNKLTVTKRQYKYSVPGDMITRTNLDGSVQERIKFEIMESGNLKLASEGNQSWFIRK